MFRSMIPWRERVPATFPRLENEMEDLVERFLGHGGEEWGLTRFTPSLNLSESEDAYDVSVELPGLKPEEVKVEFKDGNLWISGKKEQETESSGKTFRRIERRHGEFRRMIQLPGAGDEEKVDAKFNNGVLTINVPKSQKSLPKRIPVKT
jgi:HSP20 family protein